MSEEQEFLVPLGYGEAELTEKRSRFIARVWPIADEDDALAHIAETRARHRDAAHNVHAYVVRRGATRYSDDGEPQGTSGLPTLNVFTAGKIFNVCCVVTRYFGGVLLGAGGLVRAYSNAAKAALEQAGTGVVRRWNLLMVPCPYALYEPVRALVAANAGVVEAVDYGIGVELRARLPHDSTGAFLRGVADLSSGRVAPRIIGTVYQT